MTKLPHPTIEQAARMGYTKWEEAIRIGFAGILLSLVGFILSLTVVPLVFELLCPSHGGGEFSSGLVSEVMGIIFSLGVATISALVIIIGGFALTFKLDSNNSHRFSPIIINNCISCLLLTIILISIFVNDWYRAIVAAVILIISTIICYCIYRHRYHQDFINTYPGKITFV